jgi:hypothetical protein
MLVFVYKQPLEKRERAILRYSQEISSMTSPNHSRPLTGTESCLGSFFAIMMGDCITNALAAVEETDYARTFAKTKKKHRPLGNDRDGLIERTKCIASRSDTARIQQVLS